MTLNSKHSCTCYKLHGTTCIKCKDYNACNNYVSTSSITSFSRNIKNLSDEAHNYTSSHYSSFHNDYVVCNIWYIQCVHCLYKLLQRHRDQHRLCSIKHYIPGILSCCSKVFFWNRQTIKTTTTMKITLQATTEYKIYKQTDA